MTKVEYLYSQIATELGLDVPRVSFIEDGEDFHFLIERFDSSAKDRGASSNHDGQLLMGLGKTF